MEISKGSGCLHIKTTTVLPGYKELGQIAQKNIF